MSKPILLKSAAELLEAILAGKLPADAQAKRYFRAHPKMGTRDRAEVTEIVYGCLRHKRLLEHLCGGGDSLCLAAAQWLRTGGQEGALEGSGFRGDARGLAARVRALDEAALPFAVRTSLPDWLAERLLARYGETEAQALAEALNRPAPVDLRVNTLKATREKLQTHLAAEGLVTETTPYSPAGLRLRDRVKLTDTRAFLEGWFEMQDEGSQLLSLLVEPKRHETVVDFCAGAGGKTLHLGILMADTGTVYAFDVSAKRLEKLKPRLERAGLHNVRPVAIAHERDARVRRLAGKADRVLVDAPCSGVGTLRRNPDLKWRAADLAALAAGQKRILEAAAALVKPGGRLVYATCSLLHDENEDIVADFLAAHGDFRAIPAADILARRHIALPLAPPPHPSPARGEGESVDAALRLFPHRQGTDGFYAVALERRRETQLAAAAPPTG